MPDDLQRAIESLARTIESRFQQPEYLAGCEIQDITDIDNYATDNGWIEVDCAHHGRQRVRYKGFPAGIQVNDELDIFYFPDRKVFEIKGTGGTTSTGVDAVKVSKVWQPNGAATTLTADNSGDNTSSGNLYLASGKSVSADNFGSIIKNASGATADAGDVGYLDENNEYKTTTTAEDQRPNPVAVLVGGANNADIYVTKGPGRMTLNYAGSAPSNGDFLTFSTTAGQVQARTTMHPGVVARASAAGSGGAVQVELLLRTVFIPTSNSNDVYRLLAADSDFVALIDSLPGGAAVRYDTPSSGNETNLKPNSTLQLAKMVLHNTTQGDSALISDNDPTGGAGYDGEITLTASVPGTWGATDTITIRSQTNTAVSGASYYADFQITSSDVPELTRALAGGVLEQDTGGANENVTFHPFETNVTSKTQAAISQVANQFVGMNVIIPLIDRTFTALWTASGSATQRWILRVRGYWVAA